MTQETQLAPVTPFPGVALAGGVDLTGVRRRLNDLVEVQELVRLAMKAALIEGEDYGQVGTATRPSLMKPGAEKLLQLFHFGQRMGTVDVTRFDDGNLAVRCEVEVFDRQTGGLIAVGEGEANTRESRYANRWVFLSDLPAGIDPAKLPSKSFKYRTGNGSFLKYLVANDDLYTLHNTILKMSKKRALVDATLTATATSGIFSQDLEDSDAAPDDAGSDDAPRPGARQQPRSRGRQQQVSAGPQRQAAGQPLTREEYQRFWDQARSSGVTPNQVKDMLGGRQLNAVSRGDALRCWAEFGSPPADVETGEAIDGEVAGADGSAPDGDE